MTNHETARDAVIAYAAMTRTVTADGLGPLLDAYRDAVLAAAPAAASVPPPAPRADDQAALRDRIRRAACEASGNGFMWGTDMLEPDEYGEVADAVLAGLAEPADQAAVLREAADEAETVAESLRKHHEFERSTGALDVMTELRRLADEATPVAAPSPPANEPGPAVAAVRALHQPMQRGPFTICAHCSGWDGKWRCLGVVTDYPCPTIRALDGEQQPGGPCVAGEQQNETPEAEAAAYLLAVTAIEAMPGYPRLVLPEEIVAELRRLAAEAPTTTKPETGSCVHCGKTIRRIIGTLSEWWVHDPGGHTICFPEQAASSPRATPKPAAGVRQDGATS